MTDDVAVSSWVVRLSGLLERWRDGDPQAFAELNAMAVDADGGAQLRRRIPANRLALVMAEPSRKPASSELRTLRVQWARHGLCEVRCWVEPASEERFRNECVRNRLVMKIEPKR